MALGHRFAVNFIAEVTCVTNALDDAIGHAYGHGSNIKEFQINIGACACGKDITRLRAGDLESIAFVGDVFDCRPFHWIMVEPAFVIVLAAVGCCKLKFCF